MSIKDFFKTKTLYEPIQSGSKQWPVAQLGKDKKVFMEEVISQAISRIQTQAGSNEQLFDELETVLYHERQRLQRNSWRVDAQDDSRFWGRMKNELIELSLEKKNTKKLEGILREIISRYVHEIAGNFKPTRYKLARAFIQFWFARLLNRARDGAFMSRKLSLHDKIKIIGETEQLRELSKKGTIVLLPTHFSNIDGVLIGWVIHTLGLPPFIYGANLNLFNIKLYAYFMNSLGAYKVDRRKIKNKIYSSTIKTYSQSATQKGCDQFFFPSGTRSKSGGIATDLEPTLLSTIIDAQKDNYQAGTKEKVFIVPMTLNYHFVFEAPILINEHLKQEGQERYYLEEETTGSYRLLKVMSKFFTKGSDISISIGKPMDVLGNPVNNKGESITKQGNIIETKEYFEKAGAIIDDAQRDEQYTKMLMKKVVQEHFKINMIFSSHLVAFVAFELIKKQNKKLDFFSMLRIPEEEISIPYETFKKAIEKTLKQINILHTKGKVNLGPYMQHETTTLIEHGMDNIGMYHAKRPLLINKKNQIITNDLNTLYFYHNRLNGYELERFV